MPDIKIQRGLPIQAPDNNHEAKLRDAAKMYEQHFLNEMLKSMRKTVDHSKMNEPTMGEKIYTEQLDNKYVESWSDRGGVGLADLIYNQLQDRFFNRGGVAERPKGPIDVKTGTSIKIDESPQKNIPNIKAESSLPTNDVSFLLEWEKNLAPEKKDVHSPYAGDILQAFSVQDSRQIIKLGHENGLTSTLSFIGQMGNLKAGDKVEAGQKLGALSPNALGLTWQVGSATT